MQKKGGEFVMTYRRSGKAFSFLLTAILVFVLCSNTVFVKASKKSTRTHTRSTTSGNILDLKQRRIVGIWVDVRAGVDGWASFRKKDGAYNVNWSYDTQGKDFRLNIGVGGTPQNWGKTITTPWIDADDAYGNFVDFVIKPSQFNWNIDVVWVYYR